MRLHLHRSHVPFFLASGPPASRSWYTGFAGLLDRFWPVPPRLSLLQVWNGGLDQIIGTEILRNLGVHFLEISRIRVGLRQHVGILGGHLYLEILSVSNEAIPLDEMKSVTMGSPFRVQP